MKTQIFPVGRTEKRRALLEAVEGVREILESHAEESESRGTLAHEAVDALDQSGLLRLKLPIVLGGAEADPVTQMDVIEAVTRIHPSAGLCTESLACTKSRDSAQKVTTSTQPSLHSRGKCVSLLASKKGVL